MIISKRSALSRSFTTSSPHLFLNFNICLQFQLLFIVIIPAQFQNRFLLVSNCDHCNLNNFLIIKYCFNIVLMRTVLKQCSVELHLLPQNIFSFVKKSYRIRCHLEFVLHSSSLLILFLVNILFLHNLFVFQEISFDIARQFRLFVITFFVVANKTSQVAENMVDLSISCFYFES